MRDSFGALSTDFHREFTLIAAETGQGALPLYSDIVVPGWMRPPLLSAQSVVGSFAPGCMVARYTPAGFLPIDIEVRRRAAYEAMSAAACEAGIPVGLFDALILRESAYNATAVSPKRAYGLTQLMPGTAAGLGVDRFDPVQNLRGGARYLRTQLDNFGHVHLALAAYNAGPARVKGGQVPPIAETQNYVREVLDKWRRLSERLDNALSVTFGSPALEQSTQVKPLRTAEIQTF